MTGAHRSRQAARATLWLPGLAVALGAAAATAHGLYQVALAAAVPAEIAWLYALITDGLALVAYSATNQRTGSAAQYAWAVVITAVGCPGSPKRSTSPPGPPSTPPRLCGSASEPGLPSPPPSQPTCCTCWPPTTRPSHPVNSHPMSRICRRWTRRTHTQVRP